MPESELLRTQLIPRIHNFLLTGHLGREVTAALIFKSYYSPCMFLNIRRFVRNCVVCGRNKAWKNKKTRFPEAPAYTEPNLVKIFIDFVFDLPENEKCKNILLITDR